MRYCASFSNFTTYCKSINSRKHYIEKDHIRLVHTESRNTLNTVVCSPDLITLFFEVHLEQITDIKVITIKIFIKNIKNILYRNVEKILGENW